MVGKCRQNFHEEAEASINKQINIELSAYHQYLALVRASYVMLPFCRVPSNFTSV